MLYEKNYIPLCRYAYYITNSKELAEEVIQDVFMNIWNKRQRLHIEDNPKSYLYISVRNLAYNKIKELDKTYETDFIAETAQENYTLNESLFIEQLKKAIKHLPDKCRVIYCLKHFEGLTYKEIASYLGIAEKTVETQIYRALVKLRLILKPIKHKFYEND